MADTQDTGASQATGLSSLRTEPVSRLGSSSFDPSRDEIEALDWLECQTKMTRDWHYKCQEEIINFQRMGEEYALFQKQWEEREKHYRRKRQILETLCAIVKDRDEWREQHENLVYVRQADLAAVAIAMEARSGETEGLDPKDDSAGPQDIAQTGGSNHG